MLGHLVFFFLVFIMRTKIVISLEVWVDNGKESSQ